MSARPGLRRMLAWTAAILLPVAAGLMAVEVARIALEGDYRDQLATEVRRRSIELMGVTLNGNVMGSVAAMGLINQTLKRVARGELRPDDPGAIEVLRSLGESYRATGAYVVDSRGIILSNWYSVGTSLSGVDVGFRPYFRLAMQGRQTVYAAVGTTTGQRTLYFAAPLHATTSAGASAIGAVVIRLGVDRVDGVLADWPGIAMLLSPQRIVFASNRGEWIQQIAGDPSPARLESIRALRQFGGAFESGVPKVLPFDTDRKSVDLGGLRLLMDRAPVQWNDPNGEWSLLMLGDPGTLLPFSRRMGIGVASGAVTLVLMILFLVWRRRLHRADAARHGAVAELRAYSGRLESSSSVQSFLATLSADLHRAATRAEFGRTFMAHVVPRVGADYGVLYVLDEPGGLLHPIGGYGEPAERLDAVPVGQGLVGQCAKTRSAIDLSDPVSAGLRIVWGGGAVVPKSLVLLPVSQSGRIRGVMLMAALAPMSGDARGLLEAMVPIVATNLEILERNLGIRHQAELLQQQKVQLGETEAWYRGIVESSPDGMLVADEAGVIVLANRELETLFGYPPGGLQGRKIEDLVPQGARSGHVALRSGYIREGRTRAMGVLNRELRGVRRDGSEFPLEIGLSVLPALGGHGVCVCASVRDISERRERDRSLAEATALQQAILDNVPIGIFLTGDGVIQRANPAMLAIFGCQEAVLVGQPAESLWPSAREYGEFRERVVPALDRGDSVSEQLTLMRPDGTGIPCQLSGRRVAARQYSRSVIWTVEDISSRLRADGALREERERLRTIIDTSPICLAFTTQGRFRFINPAFERTFGVKVGEDAQRIYVDPQERLSMVADLQRDGAVRDRELRMYDGERRERRMLATFLPISYEGEDGVLGWLMDITDRLPAGPSPV